jgi:hypothetical protein
LILNISTENGASMYGMSFEIGAGGMSAATSGPLEVGEQVILYLVIEDSREGYRAPKERLNVWL